jgi:hypothetical protein
MTFDFSNPARSAQSRIVSELMEKYTPTHICMTNDMTTMGWGNQHLALRCCPHGSIVLEAKLCAFPWVFALCNAEGANFSIPPDASAQHLHEEDMSAASPADCEELLNSILRFIRVGQDLTNQLTYMW